MIRYYTNNGHAEFIFKVAGPNGISFHIIDRYSSMRAFQSLLRKDLDDSINLNDLPTFPKKKMFNTMDTAFLDNRMANLSNFFNEFFKRPEVARNRLVMTYFLSKPADQDSEDKIIMLHNLL